MNKLKNIMLIIYLLLFTIFILLTTFFTNGKDYFIDYSILFLIIYIALLLINMWVLYMNQNKIIDILIVFLLLFTIVLIKNIWFYSITLILYIIIFILKKKVYSGIILIVYLGIALSIHFNYIKESSYFQTFDLGFSPSKNYYVECIEGKDYEIYVYPRKQFINILNDFANDKRMIINSTSCNGKNIKWLENDVIEVDGKIYEIEF